MQMPSDPKAKWRISLAFLSLIAVFSAGAYFVRDLGKLQRRSPVGESPTALQGATSSKQTADTPSPSSSNPYPRDRFPQLLAMANKATDETNTAIEKLSNEIAPPSIARTIDFGAASQSDLAALRRDLKTAETNAATFLPRYVALLKAERDTMEQYVRANVDRSTAARFLDSIDRRHAEITAFASRMLLARADYYHAYDDYIAFLAREWGAYKVDKGELVFPLQFTYNRYNVLARAMTVAANRVGELDQEGKALLQRERWTPSTRGK
jgi:hypothetical protein